MVRKVNALKVRQNLGQLLEEVHYKGDQYVIERAGRPMASVVPVWQLKEWQERRTRFFGIVDALRSKGKKLKPEIVEREVADALVSGDQDLLDLHEHSGIRIVSPRTFLEALRSYKLGPAH